MIVDSSCSECLECDTTVFQGSAVWKKKKILLFNRICDFFFFFFLLLLLCSALYFLPLAAVLHVEGQNVYYPPSQIN